MVEYTIILDRFDVAMRLGIHPHEAVPQRVRLSVRMTATYPQAPSGDRIEEVLDYDFVRTGVLAMVAARPFALQETLCEAIAALCFEDERVRALTVGSTKLDVYPDAAIGCEITRSR